MGKEIFILPLEFILTADLADLDSDLEVDLVLLADLVLGATVGDVDEVGAPPPFPDLDLPLLWNLPPLDLVLLDLVLLDLVLLDLVVLDFLPFDFLPFDLLLLAAELGGAVVVGVSVSVVGNGVGSGVGVSMDRVGDGLTALHVDGTLSSLTPIHPSFSLQQFVIPRGRVVPLAAYEHAKLALHAYSMIAISP